MLKHVSFEIIQLIFARYEYLLCPFRGKITVHVIDIHGMRNISFIQRIKMQKINLNLNKLISRESVFFLLL